MAPRGFSPNNQRREDVSQAIERCRVRKHETQPRATVLVPFLYVAKALLQSSCQGVGCRFRFGRAEQIIGDMAARPTAAALYL